MCTECRLSDSWDNFMKKYYWFFKNRSNYWVLTEFPLSDLGKISVQNLKNWKFFQRSTVPWLHPKQKDNRFSLHNRSPARTGETKISLFSERFPSDSLMQKPSLPYFIGIFTSFLGKKYYWVILFEIPPLQV